MRAGASAWTPMQDSAVRVGRLAGRARTVAGSRVHVRGREVRCAIGAALSVIAGAALLVRHSAFSEPRRSVAWRRVHDGWTCRLIYGSLGCDALAASTGSCDHAGRSRRHGGVVAKDARCWSLAAQYDCAGSSVAASGRNSLWRWRYGTVIWPHCTIVGTYSHQNAEVLRRRGFARPSQNITSL